MNKWGEKKTAEETSYTGQTKKKKWFFWTSKIARI